MKKLIYLLGLFSIILLFSFAASSHIPPGAKEVAKKRGSCAAPINLHATVSGNTLTLTWDLVPGVSSYSCGGYYNRTGTNPPPNVINFGNVVSGNSMTVTLIPTFVSGTFRVTS